MDKCIVSVKSTHLMRDQFLMTSLNGIHIYILNKLIISRKTKKILIQTQIHQRRQTVTNVDSE